MMKQPAINGEYPVSGLDGHSSTTGSSSVSKLDLAESNSDGIENMEKQIKISQTHVDRFKQVWAELTRK